MPNPPARRYGCRSVSISQDRSDLHGRPGRRMSHAKSLGVLPPRCPDAHRTGPEPGDHGLQHVPQQRQRHEMIAAPSLHQCTPASRICAPRARSLQERTPHGRVDDAVAIIDDRQARRTGRAQGILRVPSKIGKPGVSPAARNATWPVDVAHQGNAKNSCNRRPRVPACIAADEGQRPPANVRPLRRP